MTGQGPLAEVVLCAEGLTKRYGRTLAVDGIDLRVRRGEIFGFLGPNGAGKTTTIGMVLGLVHPSSGRIEIMGERVRPRQTGVLKRVGSLVGSPGMIPHLTARENLRLLGRLHEGVDEKAIDETLAEVGLSGAADRKVKGYSLGMRQRVGLGAAMLHSPALLVLDEPTNGLDPAGMREVRELLRKLASAGTTVFLSSHLLREIEHLCDRVAVLRKGRLVAEGTVKELLGSSESMTVRISAPADAAAVLRGAAGLENVEVGPDGLHVHGISGEEIIRRLVGAGLVPSEVYAARNDLEETFLALTAES